MRQKGFVVFNLFNNEIENILPDHKVRLKKGYEIFAIIWRNPNAVLKFYKTKARERNPEFIARPPV